jgi:alpha-galactosidase
MSYWLASELRMTEHQLSNSHDATLYRLPRSVMQHSSSGICSFLRNRNTLLLLELRTLVVSLTLHTAQAFITKYSTSQLYAAEETTAIPIQSSHQISARRSRHAEQPIEARSFASFSMTAIDMDKMISSHRKSGQNIENTSGRIIKRITSRVW